MKTPELSPRDVMTLISEEADRICADARFYNTNFGDRIDDDDPEIGLRDMEKSIKRLKELMDYYMRLQ